jgi:hypothetical protein
VETHTSLSPRQAAFTRRGCHGSFFLGRLAYRWWQEEDLGSGLLSQLGRRKGYVGSGRSIAGKVKGHEESMGEIKQRDTQEGARNESM